MRLKPLREQTLVITGASSGIGNATARLAAGRGARVMAAARGEAALRRLVEDITRAGGDAAYMVVDVGDAEQVQALAERAVERFGGFDTWINNAGVTIYGRAEDIAPADHRRLFETNYLGTVHGTLAALPRLKRHGGALVNLGSVLSGRAVPLQGVYGASKHAIKAYTDAIRMELAEQRAPVSVTLIKPASMATPLQEHARNYLSAHPRLPPPVYAPEVAARAVLHVAEHPTRELIVGDTGRLLEVADAFAPGLTDRAMAATLFDLQTSGDAPGGRSNLHEPVSEGERSGSHPLVLADSTYTRLSTNPSVRTIATAAQGVTGGLVALGARSAASTWDALLRRRARSPDK